MDVTAILVTIGGLLLMGATIWFFFGKRHGSRPAAAGPLYACPMHPWITSSDPTAECSLCGMKLVRNENG